MTASPGAIRFVVSDVDGTLVDHDKRLRPATIEAVRRVRDAGVGFTVISARPPSGVEPIADALGLDTPIGAFNGGTVFRRGGEVMEQHLVPAEVGRGMLELAHGSGADVWVFAEGRWYASTPDNPHTDRERKSANQEPVIVPDLAEMAGRAGKITFVSDDPPVLARTLEQGRDRYGGQATIANSQTYYLDVTALDANKGAGVEALARAAGVSLDQVMVLGDMRNDLPMLTRAGLAAVMGQAPADVKAVADWVVASNDEDGVAQALDRLLAERG
ncbi:Cof-type HAD-IIB family hydrolase [Sphingomonas lenta]|uniref:Hydrolase Cof n=1 Tax=Sphingomonas lenta TaxID=1141887 RepID=A0A2A2SFJ1_9SPHN|nr:Cof-type HAD-IIB family hydrolase [Sphingomonas lenta]PAX07973.1 hydrolase Cof [Sphingomonas lenta]